MVSERELAAALRRVEPPGAEAAAERAWRDVEAALDAPAPRRTRRWGVAAWRRAAPVAAAALLALVAALTPPGDAVAEWLRRAVEPAPPAPAPAAPLVRVPGGGALLVRSAGVLWTVDEGGRRRRLGRWDDAAWSPRGRFVAAVRDRELAALDRRGGVRWRLTRPYALAQPAWSPGDGERIAYRSRDGLRVVAGDGTGDRLVAGPLGPAGPAWRPAAEHELAWADAAGRVHVTAPDTGVERWRTRPGAAVRRLVWAPSGRRLAVLGARGLRVLDARGRVVTRIRVRAGRSIAAAAFDPRGRHPLAYAVHDARRGATAVRVAPGRLRVGRVAGGRWGRRVFAGRGRIDDLAFAPRGGWLLLGWRGADQWVLLGAPYVTGVAALRDVSRRFGPRPRVRGWCCPP